MIPPRAGREGGRRSLRRGRQLRKHPANLRGTTPQAAYLGAGEPGLMTSPLTSALSARRNPQECRNEDS